MAAAPVVALCILMSLSCICPQEATDSEGPAAAAAAAAAPPSVVLKRQGKVTGVIQKSDSGRDFNAFMGIPFGSIPKRFTAPEPAGPFPEGFVANDQTTSCVQIGSNGVSGTEDCLTLQVYTPYLPDTETDKKLPVMVWIYGGAFILGSTNPLVHGPSHLMEHDIVLVLMNYRVGIFGFLATEDAASPGNYGLLDQNLALQWVQENIEMFGGDKNRVTIFGLSAGAASVIYQMLSPLSLGLFHGAIAMSGSALSPWARNPNPLRTAKYVGSKVNCFTDNTYELVECMRDASAEDLAKVPGRVTPVVEPEHGGLFLTEHPYRVLEEGRFNKVPLITGITLDEMTCPGLYKKDPSRYVLSREEFIASRLSTMFHETLNMSFTESEQDILRALGSQYFDDVDFSNETAMEIADTELLTDARYTSPNDLTIKFMTSHDVPLYTYLFEYVSEMSSPTHINGRPDVGHGGDFIYLFNLKLLTDRIPYPEESNEFIKKYVSLFTNFATTGNPTPSGELIWDRTPGAGGDNRFMRLGTDMKMDENVNLKRIAMWNDLHTAIMKSEIQAQ